ncbi:MAG: universal stress protein [Desulfobacterales bacterium]|nr:universal stress protein [Desulfobacterales bacterium]
MAKSKRKILLAVDGSNQAFEAVRYASRLFPPERMEVVLFHVLTKFPESFWDIEKEPEYRYEGAGIRTWEVQQNQKIQTFMEKARQLFLDQNIPQNAVRIKIQARKAGIARDIVHESQNNYDGVVVGRWGTSMLKDFLWGSIANKLIGRLTHTPVCVVGGTPQIGKILVAIDASERANRAIDYVGAMVDSSHWEVTLFHVIRDIDRKKLHKTEKIMAAIFKEATTHLEKAGFNRNQINTRVVTKAPSRANAIVVEALNGGCGTIVVGRRGLSNVKEFYMGRVSNKVIQMAREMAVWIVT